MISLCFSVFLSSQSQAVAPSMTPIAQAPHMDPVLMLPRLDLLMQAPAYPLMRDQRLNRHPESQM